jgi:hypothetical protein
MKLRAKIAQAHICRSGAALNSSRRPSRLAHIGGSARGYQELSTLLAIPVTAEQAGGQAVWLCTASGGCERLLLPR